MRIFNIGNLNPNSTIELISEYYQLLTFDDISFCFTLMSNYPSLSIHSYDTLIFYSIHFETNSKITRLISKKIRERTIKNSYKQTFDKTFTKCSIEFQLKKKYNKKYKEPINFLFRTENMNEPYLIKEYNPEKNETNYLMGMIYNPKSIEIPSEPDINDNPS